jgi:tetraacyldisaccharide 4'-kinase
MRFRDRLVAAWYRPSLTPLSAVLLPLAAVFRGVVAARRALFRTGVLKTVRVGVPVVVVGNVTVGGTGKTPLALALADSLAVRGLHPGIVSRGYGGRHSEQHDAPVVVTRDDDPADVGDEPLLYASRGFPVAIGRDRAAAAELLLRRERDVDVLISDDGLQHYRLGRDVEIAVVDGARGLGNGRMMPAGPLREPASRLREVALVVVTETPEGVVRVPPEVPKDANLFVQRLAPDASLYRVGDPGTARPVESFAGARVHAVAGIGHPQRFFATLERLGLAVTPHAFPDHHAFTPVDLALPGAAPIVMTAKDAVKCRRFADARCWYLPVRSQIDAELTDCVEKLIRGPEAP